MAKTESIQRSIQPARQELAVAGKSFASDFIRQDAAILNITRACEQAIDLANHLVRRHKLGLPKSAGNSFELACTVNSRHGHFMRISFLKDNSRRRSPGRG